MMDMNRITNPRKERYTGNTQTGWKKLQQLEDIEEELGIDLVTLFKALKKGIFYKVNYNGCIGWDVVSIENNSRLYITVRNGYQPLELKDYGKTWSLTREELENE